VRNAHLICNDVLEIIRRINCPVSAVSDTVCKETFLYFPNILEALFYVHCISLYPRHGPMILERLVKIIEMGQQVAKGTAH
jgi:hypothetical protein